VRGSFKTVPVLLDAGVTAIIVPLDSVDSGATVTPTVVVHNFSSVPVDLYATVSINDGSNYDSTVHVTGVPANSSETLNTFNPWSPTQRGVWTVKCTLDLHGDVNPGNDTMLKTVVVNRLGVEERETPVVERITSSPAIVRGVLDLPQAASLRPQATGWLLDVSGRTVMALHSGQNDVSRLGAGVYFVRLADSGERSAVRKVVIAR
jgi:hypothetical protein